MRPCTEASRRTPDTHHAGMEALDTNRPKIFVLTYRQARTHTHTHLHGERLPQDCVRECGVSVSAARWGRTVQYLRKQTEDLVIVRLVRLEIRGRPTRDGGLAWLLAHKKRADVVVSLFKQRPVHTCLDCLGGV